MYQKNLFGSRYRLSGNAQKTSHNSQTFFKRERWYLLFNNWFIFRLSPTLPEYKIKRKSLRATLESVAAGSFSWKAGARWGAGWGGISLLCLLMPPCCRFNGHVRLGGHGGADPNHTDGIIFSIRRRVCLEEKVKQKGSQVLFRCLVCCQNPNEMDVLLLELQDMLLCYTTALFADWRMWVRARRNVRKAKAAVSQHNAGNARKQQAHSNGRSVCGADMWVWWGWRGGCVTVAATQHCDCFQKPSAEARGTVRKKPLKCVSPSPSVQLPCAGNYVLLLFVLWDVTSAAAVAGGEMCGWTKVNLKETNGAEENKYNRTGSDGCMMVIYPDWRSDIITLNL